MVRSIQKLVWTTMVFLGMSCALPAQETGSAYYQSWGAGQKLLMHLWQAGINQNSVYSEDLDDLAFALQTYAQLANAGYGAIEIKWSRSYQDLRNALIQGRSDLLECDAGVYLWAQQEDWPIPYQPLLQRAQYGHWDRQTGSIFVRQNSTIQSPHQLSGRTMAIVDRQALLGGWTQSYLLLHTQGLDPERDVRVVEAGSALDALKRLVTGFGGVDAAAVPTGHPAFYDLAHEMGLADPKGLLLRPVMETEHALGVLILVHQRVPEPVRELLKKACMLHWGDDRTGPVDPQAIARVITETPLSPHIPPSEDPPPSPVEAVEP